MSETVNIPAQATVRDPQAAALLVDGRRNRFLHPFLGRVCGVTEAARTLGVSPSLVSYWVGRLVKLGLLQAAGRSGSRVRAYRSTADRFIVALRDVPMVNEDAILHAQMAPWVQSVQDALMKVAHRYASSWQFRLEPTPQGIRQTLEPTGGSLASAPLVNERAGLNLNADDAAALRAEMRALIGRYTQRSVPEQTPGHQRHLVWLVAVEAPRPR